MSRDNPEIDHLVFWVHRSFQPNHISKHDVTKEIASYFKLATVVFDNPSVGLINVDQPNNDQNYPLFDDFQNQVAAFDNAAQSVLGARYLSWPEKFVRLKEDDTAKKVIDQFGLKPRNIDAWLPKSLRDTRKPTFKYLGKASVFGRMPFSCPLNQATNFGLQEFTGTVRYYPQTTPDDEIFRAIGSGNIEDKSLRIS